MLMDGNEHGAPINGELTWGSLLTLFDYLVKLCDLNSLSRFLDLGRRQGRGTLVAFPSTVDGDFHGLGFRLSMPRVFMIL